MDLSRVDLAAINDHLCTQHREAFCVQTLYFLEAVIPRYSIFVKLHSSFILCLFLILPLSPVIIVYNVSDLCVLDHVLCLVSAIIPLAALFSATESNQPVTFFVRIESNFHELNPRTVSFNPLSHGTEFCTKVRTYNRGV